MSMRMSFSSLLLSFAEEVALNDRDWLLSFKGEQRPSFKRVSKRTSLMEAKAQRQQMKKIEESIEPRRSVVLLMFIIINNWTSLRLKNGVYLF